MQKSLEMTTGKDTVRERERKKKKSYINFTRPWPKPSTPWEYLWYTQTLKDTRSYPKWQHPSMPPNSRGRKSDKKVNSEQKLSVTDRWKLTSWFWPDPHHSKCLPHTWQKFALQLHGCQIWWHFNLRFPGVRKAKYQKQTSLFLWKSLTSKEKEQGGLLWQIAKLTSCKLQLMDGFHRAGSFFSLVLLLPHALPFLFPFPYSSSSLYKKSQDDRSWKECLEII